MPTYSLLIEKVQHLTDDTCRLVFRSEEIAKTALAGQFLHVRPRGGNAPLLRRPFSIHDVDPLNGTVEILFHVVGMGTRVLADKREGDTLDILGPLGRGFRCDETVRSGVIVAGGIGIAPFPLLVRRLGVLDAPVTVLAGWRTSSEMVTVNRLEQLGASVKVATEDGSHGYRGLVTDLLIDHLETYPCNVDTATLYACGPTPMLARVTDLASARNIPCQVSLEEMMACGIGACAGCAVPRRTEPGGEADYALVCRDGPVFDIQEVMLK